ncbi:hypothetical protein K438DRAFT_1836424 [Mycena galopus ATCC 62051]|nr:hypothetical protein K438DRAFT_1836424 [Mycena galopus ATCC 62051]
MPQRMPHKFYSCSTPPRRHPGASGPLRRLLPQHWPPSPSRAPQGNRRPVTCRIPCSAAARVRSTCECGEIMRMDTIAGDAICRLTLKGGAQRAEKAIKAGKITGTTLSSTSSQSPRSPRTKWSERLVVLCVQYSSPLSHKVSNPPRTYLHLNHDARALGRCTVLSAALNKLYTYAHCRPPSRTLVNPLAAFVGAFNGGFEAAVKEFPSSASFTSSTERHLPLITVK